MPPPLHGRFWTPDRRRRIVVGSAAAPPGGGLLLDSLSAGLAVSFRQLRTAYAGNCIRVRRASDSFEQDVGFSSGWLNETALESVCSGTDGYIAKWYDQSGNARDLTSTGSDQPQIVSSGSTIKRAGKPAALFDGDFLEKTSVGFASTLDASAFYVCAADKDAGMLASDGGGGNFDTLFRTTTGDTSTPSGIVYRIDGTEDATIDVRSELSDAIYSSPTFPTRLVGVTNYNYGLWSNYRVGGRTFMFSGWIQETLLFDSDVTASYSTIEADINSAFLIY